MSMQLKYYIVTLIVKCICTYGVTVERSSSGDSFDAACNSCRSYDARCAKHHLHCCHTCACGYGYTFYESRCHNNLVHNKLQCEMFLEKDEYFGLKTHQLSERLTHLGYIKDKWYWNRKVFNKCTIDEGSTYWDTRKWTRLFSDGRLISDFHFDNDDGVILKLWFDAHDSRSQLYTGLLIKLSLTCYSDHPIPHFHSLMKTLDEISLNGLHTLKTCLVIKFAGKRSYYESSILPTIKMSTKLPAVVTTNTQERKKEVANTSPISVQSKGMTSKFPTVVINSKGVQSKTEFHKIATTNTPHFNEGNSTTHTKIVSKQADERTSTYSEIVITPAPVKDVETVSAVSVVILTLSAVLLLITAILCIRCHRRPATLAVRRDFVASYGSTDSGSLLNSHEYAVVATPTYSDLRELQNWEKMKKKNRDNDNYMGTTMYFPNEISYSGTESENS